MSVPVESDEPANAVRVSTFINTIDRNSNEIEVLQKSGINYTDAVVVQTVTNGDTTHAPSGDAVYDFTNGIIVQTVTNGDTTHAPSGDAVFDAVATAVAPYAVTAWTAVSFTNSWVDYGSSHQGAQYRKVGDVVEIRGAIKNGTLNTSAFTLPSGFRPPAKMEFDGIYGNANNYLMVNTDGTVEIHTASNSYAGLNGVRFSVST